MWYTPLSCIRIFDTKVSLKPGRAPVRIFSIPWHKKFSAENRDTPPPHDPINFSVPEIIFNTDGLLYELFRYCELLFGGKSWYSLPPPPWSNKFFGTRNYLKHRWAPIRIVSVLWVTFRRKIVIAPSLLSLKFFDTRIIFLWHRKVFHRNFSILRQKIFDGKTWYPSYLWNFEIFRYQNNFPVTQRFPIEGFRYWETKNIRPKIVIPFLSLKFFDTRIIFL